MSVAAPTRTRKDRRLSLDEVGALLVADGLATAETVARLVDNRRLQRSDVHPLVTIANERWKAEAVAGHPLSEKVLTIEALTEWLAGRVGLGYFHIDPLKVNFAQVTDIMSSAYAERFRILPVALKGEEVVIATAEPFVREWEEEIARMLRVRIRRVLANPIDIARYVIEFYNLARSVKRAAQIGDGRGGGGFEQLVEIGASNKQYDANDQHIVNIVDWLWQYAFDQRASDIHVEPRREIGVVRFRIDGVLHEVYQVPATVVSAMTSRIKILGRMDVVEKRRPQDGRIKTRAANGQEIELRLSTLPTAFGEKLVMRIFDPDVLMKDFADLGFGEEDRTRWTQMTARPHGIILVTGPTGSGKTTTLYSTLKSLATSEVNVCTIEDPIEMVEPAFNQMQVQPAIDLGFAEGVRALMRQDPDIIMIGEIRDLETAEMAIQAALTGHLVLSTLHTNDAVSAITRLVDLGVAPYMLGATVLGVMAQRLVRTLCVRCKERVTWDGAPAGQIGWDALVKPFTSRKPTHLWRPVGCLDCRMTGYRGRAGLYEVMLLSPELRKLIAAGADLAMMRAVAYREGMKPLRISGALKVAAGLTTVEEVVKVTPPPEGADD
jgi:general secretion pathway protein E